MKTKKYFFEGRKLGKHSLEKEDKHKKNKKKKAEKNFTEEDKKYNSNKSKKNKAKDNNTVVVNSSNNSSKNKKKKKGRAWKKILLAILILIIACAVYFEIRVKQNGGGMKGIVSTIVGTDSKKISNLDDLYLLVLGKSQNMTDTIMVVKYSPKNQEAALLSVPRDSFVGKSTANATAFDKINSRYQLGAQNVLDAVNGLTGLNLKYYVTIDTKALRDLVDAIGGVYFDVPIDMDYDDSSQDLHIHIKKGYQLLNGEQAEGVVRFRHNNNYTSYPIEYGDNDLGRMRTQRAFIETVLKQTLKAGNITKLNQLINIAKEEIATNMPWDTLKDYGVALLDFDASNLKTDALPGAADYYNGLSFFIVNKTKSKQVINELFIQTNENTESTEASGNTTANTVTSTSTTTKINRSKIKIEVLNGTGSTDRYDNAVAQLKNYGYNVTKKGTTNFTNKTLIIDRKSASTEIKNEIKALLCTGIVSVGEDNSNVDFTIVIGLDY